MKLLLLLCAIFVFSAANAQEQPDNSQKQKFKWKFERPLVTIEPKDSSALRLYPYAKKAPGVYRLPQDGMPCIVPESHKSVKIPNAWRVPLRVPFKNKPPRIPNPSDPPRLYLQYFL
jgi:hypothetical protein